MSNVFVPHIPARFDSAAKIWTPTVDLSKAKRFGEIIEVLQPGAYRMAIAQLIPAIKYQMRHFDSADSLIAVGDPSIIAACAMVAANRTHGFIKMLKWDRSLGDYIQLEIQV